MITEACGEHGDHRQDRSFLRIGQGVVRVLAALADRIREIARGEVDEVFRGVADALEELCNDRARVAAGAVEQHVCEARQKCAKTVAPGPGKRIQRGAE